MNRMGLVSRIRDADGDRVLDPAPREMCELPMPRRANAR